MSNRWRTVNDAIELIRVLGVLSNAFRRKFSKWDELKKKCILGSLTDARYHNGVFLVLKNKRKNFSTSLFHKIFTLTLTSCNVLPVAKVVQEKRFSYAKSIKEIPTATLKWIWRTKKRSEKTASTRLKRNHIREIFRRLIEGHRWM